jgi:lysophospholipase L1-like esterase
MYMGKIVNKQRHNDLTQSYDVNLMDWGVTLRQCKRASEYASYNGNGEYKALQNEDPVIILCKNGVLEDAVIIRSFWTNGEWDKFLNKGEGNKPGELIGSDTGQAEANQTSIHPNRVTQPEADFSFIGSKVMATAYDSPEFHDTIQDKAASRGQTGSIIMKNGTELVSYTFGSIINYSDGNNITVSGGTTEEKCTQMLRLASTHSRIAYFIGRAIGGSLATTASGVKPLVPVSDTPPVLSDFNEPLPATYRAEQNQELSKLALDRAKDCNTQSASTMAQADILQTKYGNETGSKPSEVKLAVDGATYMPADQRNAAVNPANMALRNTTQVSGESIYRTRYKAAFKTEAPPGSPKYSDWLSLFEKESSTSGASIIAGDSIVQRIPPTLLNNKVLNQGISGESSIGLLNRANQIASNKPKTVVLAVGINDLLAGRNREDVYKNLMETVKRINTASPTTKIYIQSILPKSAPDEITAINKDYKDKIANVQNKDILWINDRLRASGGTSYSYFDAYSSIVSSNGSIKKEFTTDGIHLTGSAYTRLTELLNTLL